MSPAIQTKDFVGYFYRMFVYIIILMLIILIILVILSHVGLYMKIVM